MTRTRARARPRRGRIPIDELRVALRREPLVGVKAASGILGIATSNFRRYRHRLDEIPVEGTGAVFFRRDVERLRDQLAAERAARARA